MRWKTWVNDIVLRYADILLSKAEAIIETNGNVADAIAILNQIRTERDDVKISLLPTSMSREEEREQVRHERRIELALEGRYWADVRRWKKRTLAKYQAGAKYGMVIIYQDNLTNISN